MTGSSYPRYFQNNNQLCSSSTSTLHLKHDQSRSNDLIPLFAFGVMEALIGDETATTSKKMSRCRIGLSICCGDRPSSSLLTIRGLKCHGIRKWMVCINFG
eukprot:TRINITY_DN7448_c0_g1_i1.p1 TRINITY_DN7448_c0_g1~~TRINITY_DN7448_c0_g1_i1.p1  ORF type:complete len:101 (-),score=6.09 TRINITY_DN7448_c0_g1_i1:148-450(-)